jgi:ABC-type multidrug transport system ATPase subunit
LIRLEGVCLFGGGRVLLDDVHLAVRAGELVVVHGPAGAGKTLLLAIAAARRPPAQGAVAISGRSVAELQRSSLPLVHRSVGYLPPHPPLIDDETAIENVMLALAVRGAEVAASEGAALRALAALGLQACADRRVETLAGGERRLVALARALAGAPPLLVLDEPTAGLDARERDRALTALAAARDQGATVLMATSDDDTVRTLVAQGGRRARLEGGRLHGGLPGITLLPRRKEEGGAPPVARIELRRQGP